MPQVVFDFPSDFFSALRRSPEEFAAEMRIAAAVQWYAEGEISQGKAAEMAGISRRKLIDELARRHIPAIQTTIEELREELARDC